MNRTFKAAVIIGVESANKASSIAKEITNALKARQIPAG